MSIKSELEKLHDQILFSYQNIKDDKLYQKDAKVRLNQTTQAILSEFERMIPTEYPCNTPLDQEEEKVRWYHDGFNACLSTIKAKLHSEGL